MCWLFDLHFSVVTLWRFGLVYVPFMEELDRVEGTARPAMQMRTSAHARVLSQASPCRIRLLVGEWCVFNQVISIYPLPLNSRTEPLSLLRYTLCFPHPFLNIPTQLPSQALNISPLTT